MESKMPYFVGIHHDHPPLHLISPFVMSSPHASNNAAAIVSGGATDDEHGPLEHPLRVCCSTLGRTTTYFAKDRQC